MIAEEKEAQGQNAANLPFLDPLMVRVLGCLMEKSATTPEYYPLTLNSLVNACNQKSNRSPVMQVEEGDVAEALEALIKIGLAQQLSLADSRVLKYKHLAHLAFTEDEQEQAILCELLLRGPQTYGELRGRCERMASFAGLEEVQAAVQRLIERAPALVFTLPRQSGRKESRHTHLLAGMPDIEELAPPKKEEPALVVIRADRQRIDELEAKVSSLEQELAELRAEFLAFKSLLE